MALWVTFFVLVKLLISARKDKFNLYTRASCRTPRVRGRIYTRWLFVSTSFVQISVARERDMKMNKTWFLLLRCSWISGGDKVGHRSLQCYNVKIENWELTAGPLLNSRCPLWAAWLEACWLGICFFPYLTEGSHLWWSSLCEVYAHHTAKEKSLLSSLDASDQQNLTLATPWAHTSQEILVLSAQLLIFFK